MQAYITNLARSPERRAHVVAEIERTGARYEIVEGVDGRDLDVGDTRLVAPDMVAGASFQPGVAGCALSHLKIYARILEDGHDCALVLEDDVTLPEDLAEVADEVAGHMGGAEAVLLNFHSAQPCRLSTRGAVALRASRQLVFPVDVGQLTSTVAYLVTRRACENLVRTLLPVRAHADDWARFCRLGALERVRCVVPVPIGLDPSFRSTIDPARAVPSRLREAVAQAKPPVLHRALAWHRQRVIRQWSRTELVDEPSPFN